MMTVEDAKNYIGECNGTVIKLGLERISELLDILGRPQDRLKFIHVTGTNGKGSFCALLAAVFTAAGHKIGCFSSPAIVSINDTISVNGKDITDYEFICYTERIKAAAEKCSEKPTSFELEAALAMVYFLEMDCEFVLLEAGMGGRLDATNVIDTNILSVITSVALDHTKFLGGTTAEIAAEKAGIIKNGSPVLFGSGDEAALAEIHNAANFHGSKLFTADYSDVYGEKLSLDGGTFFNTRRYKSLHLNLLGKYQLNNAVLVLNAVDILRGEGVNLPDIAIYEGFEKAVHRGRFELMGVNPIFISDGAHNLESVTASVESWRNYFGEGRAKIVMGVMADKDFSRIVPIISKIADEVFTAAPDNPRALDAEKLAALYREQGVKAAACGSVGEAVKSALEASGGMPVFSIGSLYMYKDIIGV